MFASAELVCMWMKISQRIKRITLLTKQENKLGIKNNAFKAKEKVHSNTGYLLAQRPKEIKYEKVVKSCWH
uniref:Uncharacterized protein n=1 Tax=Arundo donax TaxID=35708 RepID=A0A0A9H421_ARUDO